MLLPFSSTSICFVARQGADTCAIGGVLKESALMWAARQGYMTIIVDLLRVSDSSTNRLDLLT